MKFFEASRSRRHRSKDAPTVVIAGGGVAALEAALGLRDLLGDKVNLTLLSPSDQFAYQPAGVLQPFENKPPRRLLISEFAEDVKATYEQDALVSVDVDAQTLVTGSERELAYDLLLVATGAKAVSPLEEAILLNPARPDERLSVLVEEIEKGLVQSLALFAPKPAWPLPVYELALLLRDRANKHGNTLQLTVVTAEKQPLEAFGQTVSTAAADALARAEIQLVTDSSVTSTTGTFLVSPANSRLNIDRIIAIPRLEGPRIKGLPQDDDGFLPVTASGAVLGVKGVYAAGDGTNFPVKFGAIAAQQADAAVESIGSEVDTSVTPTPFDGTVHGILFDGQDHDLYFSARLEGGSVYDSLVSDTQSLPHQAKIAARFLGPYLDERWAAGSRWVTGQLAWEKALSKIKGESS